MSFGFSHHLLGSSPRELFRCTSNRHQDRRGTGHCLRPSLPGPVPPPPLHPGLYAQGSSALRALAPVAASQACVPAHSLLLQRSACVLPTPHTSLELGSPAPLQPFLTRGDLSHWTAHHPSFPGEGSPLLVHSTPTCPPRPPGSSQGTDEHITGPDLIQIINRFAE